MRRAVLATASLTASTVLAGSTGLSRKVELVINGNQLNAGRRPTASLKT
jgi:hypothetical protein